MALPGMWWSCITIVDQGITPGFQKQANCRPEYGPEESTYIMSVTTHHHRKVCYQPLLVNINQFDLYVAYAPIRGAATILVYYKTAPCYHGKYDLAVKSAPFLLSLFIHSLPPTAFYLSNKITLTGACMK